MKVGTPGGFRKELPNQVYDEEFEFTRMLAASCWLIWSRLWSMDGFTLSVLSPDEATSLMSRREEDDGEEVEDLLSVEVV